MELFDCLFVNLAQLTVLCWRLSVREALLCVDVLDLFRNDRVCNLKLRHMLVRHIEVLLVGQIDGRNLGLFQLTRAALA